MFINNLDPVLLTIGSLSIRWYGLVYVLGFIAAYFAYNKIAGLNNKESESLMTWLIIGMILGSRLFHFLFYAWQYVIPSYPWDITTINLFSISIPIPMFFAIWKGGMSFHGALLGIVIAGYYWAKRNEKDFWLLADTGAIVAAFFLAIGRIANFINSEIVGKLSSLPWCVEFPRAAPPLNEGCRHPVQLYAMMKDLFIGSTLLLLMKIEHKPGFIFWIFTLLYGVLRFIVNYWRTDPILFLNLAWGHILSLLLVIVALYMLFKNYKEDLENIFKA